jgi:GTPase SAR1 family protein
MSRRSLVFVILGESGVGKTSLTDKVAHDTQYHHYDPFHSSESYTRMVLQLGSDLLDISIMDISLTPIRATEDGFVGEIFDNALREADGVVLLYDITREESYTHVTDFGWDYVWGCRAQDDESGLEYPLGKS